MRDIFSFPLFKENLKRFWGFSFVAFLCYFFSCNFIILLDFDRLQFRSSLIFNAVSCRYFPYVAFDVIFPIIASCLVFNYLFKANSVGLTHAMPFSRKSLFVTNYLSGLVLCVIPILADKIILAAMQGHISACLAEGNIALAFTLKSIILSFAADVLYVFFTFSIACLAASISGNAVIELLTAGALNFIVPLTIVCILCYQGLFLSGFTGAEGMARIALMMHPVLQVFSGTIFGIATESFTALNIIPYFIAALAVSFAAYLLYSRRSMEKAGDSYVYEKIKYFIGACFVFFPATVLAMLFDGSYNIIIGLVVGGFCGFIVGWMIISKSFKIFNLKALKAFAIGAGFTVLVCLFFIFDIGGFETKIPKINKIKEAELHINLGYDGTQMKFTDKENLQSVINVHKAAMNSEAEPEIGDIAITYTMNNGLTLSRYYYDVGAVLSNDSGEIAKLFESPENDVDAKSLMDLIGPKTSIDLSSVVYYEDYGDSRLGVSIGEHEKDELKKELIEAVSLDLQERTYAEFLDQNDGWGLISIESGGHENRLDNKFAYSYPEYGADGKIKGYCINANIMFNDDYEHLITVLEKYDLLETIRPDENSK